MAFLITTTAEVTLTDLGNRVIPASTVGFDLEAEYRIEEIRYSESLAAAIFAGSATAIDQFGRTITAQASLALTEELLRLSFHMEDTDDLAEGSTNKYYTDTAARNAISIAAGELNLTYNSTTGELDFSNGPTFSDAVTINGDLTVNGTTTTVNSEDLSITDNTITLNNGETGAGVSLGQAGIKIDRGTEDPYVFLFDEPTDTFRIGSTLQLTDGSFDTTELQAVATREDNPISEGIAYWNATESRFDTDTNFTWDVANEFLYVGTSYISQAKIDTWDSIASGGITSVTAGDGLTSTGTNDITLNVVGGSGITANVDDIEVNVDNSTIEITSSDNLSVVAGGITELELSTSVAGNGLAGGGGTALSVNVDGTSIVITTDTLGVNTDGINDTHIDWGTGVNQVNAADMPIVDTADNFVATNVEDALTEIYENAGAKNLEDLDDVDMPTGTLGGNDVLKYNSLTGQWEPGSITKTWSISATSQSKKTTNRYLDRQDGLATNLTPYISFYDAFISKIVLNSNIASAWTAEVRVNGSAVASLVSGGSKSAVSADLAVSVSAGDEISIYVNGSNVNRPAVEVLFEQDIF